MGVGGSLDLMAGTFSRAPLWMQTSGLEWFYRACQEPRRLGSRYCKDAYGLFRHLPGQLASSAIQPRKPLHSGVQAGGWPIPQSSRLKAISLVVCRRSWKSICFAPTMRTSM